MAINSEKVIECFTSQPAPHEHETRPEIYVVFTSPSLTMAALKKAGVLAGSLRARVLMLLARVVPYPLAIENPPIAMSIDEARIRPIATWCPAEARVLLCLCRDEWDVLRISLAANSIVMLGHRKRWWPTREAKLARRLRHAGHHVIFAEAE